MDFDEAIGNHSKWKRRLRQSLTKRDGSLNPSEVSLDHKMRDRRMDLRGGRKVLLASGIYQAQV